MIPVLEWKVELLSNHRWRVTDEDGRSLVCEKARDIGYAVQHLLEQRARRPGVFVAVVTPAAAADRR